MIVLSVFSSVYWHFACVSYYEC